MCQYPILISDIYLILNWYPILVLNRYQILILRWYLMLKQYPILILNWYPILILYWYLILIWDQYSPDSSSVPPTPQTDLTSSWPSNLIWSNAGEPHRQQEVMRAPHLTTALVTPTTQTSMMPLSSHDSVSMSTMPATPPNTAVHMTKCRNTWGGWAESGQVKSGGGYGEVHGRGWWGVVCFYPVSADEPLAAGAGAEPLLEGVF